LSRSSSDALATTSETSETTATRRPQRVHAVETVIQPASSAMRFSFGELWRYRHLFVALVWRNVRMEFDATRFGAVWACVRPLLYAIVFGLFRNFSGADTRVDIPNLLYIYSGLLLWIYFTESATISAGAVRSDVSLLTKVYYPRILSPLVPIVANLFSFGVGLIPLAAMMVWYGIHPGWPLLLLPLLLLQCVALALGLGTLVSTLTIEHRDWERFFAYALTIGLWLSPVIYAPEMIPLQIRDIYHANPMVGLLMGFRATLFDGFPIPVWEWAYSAVCTVVLLVIGVWMFRRTELSLAERL